MFTFIHENFVCFVLIYYNVYKRYLNRAFDMASTSERQMLQGVGNRKTTLTEQNIGMLTNISNNWQYMSVRKHVWHWLE